MKKILVHFTDDRNRGSLILKANVSAVPHRDETVVIGERWYTVTDVIHHVSAGKVEVRISDIEL